MLPPAPAHVHFVGIGGVGLSAIARVMLERGWRISGSDRALNRYTDALARDGARIHAGHAAAHVLTDPPDAVIISSAIRGNPEVDAAVAQGIPVYKRMDVIGALLAGQFVVAVAGSHGKTTTSAMVTHVLQAAGLQPGYIVGGTLATTGANGGGGAGQVFVIEADEYDHMFLGLNPDVALVTNVEWDHPDFFLTPEAFQSAFTQFAARITPGGALIACAEDPGAAALAAAHAGRALTYGATDRAAWRLSDLHQAGGETRFTAHAPDGASADVVLAVPGRVNALNALGALAAAVQAGAPLEQAAQALASFAGVGRRFDVLGEAAGVVVIDDYAHNPAKIRAVLEAARSRYPDRDLWAVWQPHTFSRTRAFLHAYAQAFSAADHVLVTEIYPAREQASAFPGVDGASTAAALHHPDAHFVAQFSEAVARITAHPARPAAVVVMSAGDADQIGRLLLARLQE